MLAAEGDESSLLDATGDFPESFGAANRDKVFVEKLVSGRECGFFFTGPFSFAASPVMMGVATGSVEPRWQE